MLNWHQSKENPQYLVGKIDVDAERELAQKFRVFAVLLRIYEYLERDGRQYAGCRQHTQIAFLQNPEEIYFLDIEKEKPEKPGEKEGFGTATGTVCVVVILAAAGIAFAVYKKKKKQG